MNNADFNKLTESIRQAGKIRRGTMKMKASRVRIVEPEDIRSIRQKLKKTQSEFALMIGVSVATLQNWEQGRRKPEGPAQALLRVAAKNPLAVAEALGT
jgi:putative transcriptional regulator